MIQTNVVCFLSFPKKGGEEKLRYNRIVLKISGEGLRNKGYTRSFSMHAVERRAEDIKNAHEKGVQIVIIPGAGNIVRGKELTNISRATADEMGMKATNINLQYLQEVLQNKGMKVRRFSAIRTDGTPMYMREKAINYLKEGKIVIIGGGIGTTFHTTDNAAIIRALELDADAILKGTKVDGIYQSYPPVTKNEKPVPELTYKSALKIKLNEMFDKSAINKLIDEKADIPIHIFNIFEKGNLLRILDGENVGTVILPKLPEEKDK